MVMMIMVVKIAMVMTMNVLIRSLYLQAERMALVGKNTKKDAPCQCCQETELLPFISNTGLLSLVADTPGLVNYRVKEVGDWTLPNESLCSIIVQSIPKVWQ